MTTTRVLILAAMLLACDIAMAQTEQSTSRAPTVYKCTNANGSVTFSDKPCSDAGSMQTVDTSAALRTGSGGHNGEIAASVANSDCRQRAQQSAYHGLDTRIEESNRHIADYQRQKSELASRKVYSPDGSGKLVEDPEATQTVAKIDAALVKERDFQAQAQKEAGTANRDALKACDAAAAKKSP